MKQIITKENAIKTYKVTDADMKCRGFQFELGKQYESNNPVRCTENGFHSCKQAAHCFRYYDFNPKNRVFECLVWGEVDDSTNDTKIASQFIVVLREIHWHEVLDIVNTGMNNTGINNSGNQNSGHLNSGYLNSGDQNSCNYSSGFFNSVESDVIMFNKPTGLKRSQINIPYIDLRITEWVYYTDAEMKDNPAKSAIGGYLKTYGYKEAWGNWLKTASKDIIAQIKALPNYDAQVFFDITGIDWRNK